MSTFILKWNPAISSCKYPAYLNILKNPYVMRLNWSIHDWREMKAGDRVFFLRVGEKPQLLASGYITGQPYQGEDWSGRGREVYYADLYFDVACHPDYEHVLTAETLEKEIGDFDWRAGHSGVLLTEQQAETLELLWTEFLYDHQDDFYREYFNLDDEDEYEDEEDFADNLTSDEVEDEEDFADDPTGDEVEDDNEPFVGIIGCAGNTFDIAYGLSEEVSNDSVLQKIFTRKYGNDCEICGYNFQRLFDVSPDYSNTYLYVPALIRSDWKKKFVCVCRSCEEVLADDPKRFVEALNRKEQKNVPSS